MHIRAIRNDNIECSDVRKRCATMRRRSREKNKMKTKINHFHGGLIWNLLCILVAFLIHGFGNIVSVNAIRRGNLLTPQTYSPINGDLNIQLQYFSQHAIKSLADDSIQIKSTSPSSVDLPTSYSDVRLQVSRYDGINRTTVGIIDVYPDPRLNITQITVSCLNFLFGGTYELEIVGNDVELDGIDNHDERLRQQLDVRWPQPKLSVTPESIGTYPQQTVDVILEFPGIECIVPHSQIDNVPEFWLELYYCGHEVYCDSTNITSSQVLYEEQVRGYPKARLIKLRCELFGLAGHYIVKLRPVAPVSATVAATAYIKADWSDQFIFNVHARSISPCDPHTGIGVLFEYPACILDRADRVRLFGKLRADVASLAPPTTLHYITEQRVIRGQHSLHFDCDYFSERFVEYCFKYVSQAISGAVADIRMDCLPTLPVRDSDVGGWGPWSNWTPCSTTCAGGTRNRYRVCDSPPPRYGAMFCEGSAVETEECGGTISDSWECIYGATGSFLPSDLPAERPEVQADVGLDCRCGCIIHLTVSKPRRLIAASAQSCPGRTFWLIQADPGHRIRFNFDFFRLICSTQYIRIRDGDSLAAELVAEYIGGSGKNSESIVSSDSKLLLEFYSNELSTIGESCKGGFLTHAQQIQTMHPNTTVPRTSKAIMSTMITPTTSRITMVHIIAILFTSIIIVVSVLLGAQYVFRYRKYQLAESIGEPDSPAHTPRASLSSVAVGHLSSRAASTSTLLSEVVSLVKIRPRGRWMKHSRLRESVDGEAMESVLNGKKSQSEEDDISNESTHTLTNETFNDINGTSHTKRQKNNKQNKKITTNSNEALSEHLSSSPSSSYSSSGGCGNDNENEIKNGSSRDRDDGNSKENEARNSISLPPTPLDTPMPSRRVQTKKKNTIRNYSREKQQQNETNANNHDTAATRDGSSCNTSSSSSGGDEIATETKSVNGKSSKKRRNKLNGMREVDENSSERDTNSIESSNKRAANGTRRSDAMKKLSISNVTLRNSAYSPVSSIISVSTNRSSNIKENKEKRNREKLLAGPGSEFSLANPEDLELDYYDYNVINAGAAPGSYLGMDPAYLVWIPPLDDGDDATIDGRNYDDSENSTEGDEKDEDGDESDNDNVEPHYEEITLNYRDSQFNSNAEMPNKNDGAPTLPPLNKNQYKINDHIDKNLHNVELIKIVAANTFKEISPKSLTNRRSSSSLIASSLLSGSQNKSPVDSIQMKEFYPIKSNNNYRFSGSPAKVHHQPQHSQNGATDDKDNDTEKETAVVKSPSDNINEYYELDDIQFADDDDDDYDDDDGGGNGFTNTLTDNVRIGQCDNKGTLVLQ